MRVYLIVGWYYEPVQMDGLRGFKRAASLLGPRLAFKVKPTERNQTKLEVCKLRIPAPMSVA